MTSGKRIKLSNGRRLVDDVIHMALHTPTATVKTQLNVSVLNQLRRYTRPKISWNVILMKAYSIICKKFPELKRVYVKFPWPHLHEHYQTVCMLAMTREFENEQRLFFARFKEPENYTLVQLQQQYDSFRQTPVEEIQQFMHQVRFARLPTIIRRSIWWAISNIWLSQRALQFGTFGMSLSGYRGVEGTSLLGPNTTTLGVDPMPRNGISRLLLTFDHRVIDGKPVSDIVESMKATLANFLMLEIQKTLRDQGLDPNQILHKSNSDRTGRRVA